MPTVKYKSAKGLLHALEHSLALLRHRLLLARWLLLPRQFLENAPLLVGQPHWDLHAQLDDVVPLVPQHLHALSPIKPTSPFSTRLCPSCEPCGMLSSLLPQTVSNARVVPRAACEMVSHSVEWMSSPTFRNLGCLLTLRRMSKSPLGPFSLWSP